MHVQLPYVIKPLRFPWAVITGVLVQCESTRVLACRMRQIKQQTRSLNNQVPIHEFHNQTPSMCMNWDPDCKDTTWLI
jgi:hypothetical protein